MKKTIGIIQIVLGVLLILGALPNFIGAINKNSINNLPGEEITEQEEIMFKLDNNLQSLATINSIFFGITMATILGLFGLLFILEGLSKLDFKKKEVKIDSKGPQSKKNIRKV